MEVTADITYKIFGIILVFIILKFNWDRRKIYATFWKCDGAFMSVFNSLNAALAPSSGKCNILITKNNLINLLSRTDSFRNPSLSKI